MCDLCQLSALDVSAVKLLAQDAAPSDPHQLVHHAPSQVVPRAMSVHRPAPPQVGNCPGQVQDDGVGGDGGGDGDVSTLSETVTLPTWLGLGLGIGR